jgi:hypothetical protein
VFILLGAALPGLDDEVVGEWMLAALATAVTTVAAALSYRFVEQPIRVSGFRSTLHRLVVPWRFGKRAVAAALASVLLVVGTGTLTAYALLSDPGKSALEQQLELAQDEIRNRELETPQPMSEPEPPVLPTGEQITAIGDSVMLAAAPQLQEAFPGISIDAIVSRQMLSAPETLRAYVRKDALRPILILGLGTNGPIDAATLEEVRATVGPDTLMVLVNTQAPRDWIPGVNEILERFAQRYRSVELANWHGAIAPRIGELNQDQVHPGGPISSGIYVSAVVDALQRLAELPPLRDDDDYRLLPRPV